MLFMKCIFFSFCCFIGSLAFFAVAAEAVEAENDSLTDSIIQYDQMEVNCGNVLSALQRYFDLNEKNNSLLGVSANRFSSAISSGKTDDEMQKLEEEISNSVFLIQENHIIFSDKAYAIMEVLPSCLKK